MCVCTWGLGGGSMLPCTLKILPKSPKLPEVIRSGGGVVDNTLDYQSRGRKIDPPLLRSFG